MQVIALVTRPSLHWTGNTAVSVSPLRTGPAICVANNVLVSVLHAARALGPSVLGLGVGAGSGAVTVSGPAPGATNAPGAPVAPPSVDYRQ